MQSLTQARHDFSRSLRAVGRSGRRAGRAMPAYEIINRRAPNAQPRKPEEASKAVRRWHRDRYYPVAAQIRAILPRYRHLNDREMLAHSFRLSDAQELVARKAGFESWEALRKGVETMTDREAETLARPVLLAAEPQLFVADIAAACAFYTAKLALRSPSPMASRRSTRRYSETVRD